MNGERLHGRLTMSVPEAGRIFYGLGRDASYAAADRGDIPSRKIGRRRLVFTHAVLEQLGMSDDLIALALGLVQPSANSEGVEGPLRPSVGRS